MTTNSALPAAPASRMRETSSLPTRFWTALELGFPLPMRKVHSGPGSRRSMNNARGIVTERGKTYTARSRQEKTVFPESPILDC